MKKFATWNVNSLAIRLPQVLDWLAAHPVDALVLQETKAKKLGRTPVWMVKRSLRQEGQVTAPQKFPPNSFAVANRRTYG